MGGSCVELEANGQRIVLDIGLPLSASDTGDAVPLPDIAGLSGGDPTLLGIILSHAHPDHYGLIEQVSADVPVYAGRATAAILREAAFFTPGGVDLRLAGELAHGEVLRLGPFTVTPYLVDHSAFDAYALLVEAGGRRLFYSGDLRSHGRKQRRFKQLVQSPPAGVTVLMLEGTTVGRAPTSQSAASEKAVEEDARRVFLETDGLALCFFSPQNIDRLVSLFRAAKRAGRIFVYDLYAASVARATLNPTIPQPTWPEVRVYMPHSQRAKVIMSGEFGRVDAIKNARIYGEELATDPKRFVMLFRTSMGCELERGGCLDGARAIWAQWPGYLEEPSGERTKAWLSERRIPFEIIHASGHAGIEDLRRLADAFAGARLVPIHTAHPERFAEEFGRAELHTDGEWWSV